MPALVVTNRAAGIAGRKHAIGAYGLGDGGVLQAPTDIPAGARYEGRVMNMIRPIAAPAESGPLRAFLGVTRSLTGRRWVDRLDGAGAMAALAVAQQHDIPDIV